MKMSAVPAKVVLLSYHYLESKRRAGFHWLADAYWRMGWDVVFVTAPISRISRLRGNFRFEYPVLAEANRLKRIRPGLSSYVLFTTLHPIDLRLQALNSLAAPLFKTYARADLGELEPELRSADLVVFESTPALLLFDRLRAMNRRARFVYRVSDDFDFIGAPPLVRRAEIESVTRFDLVSTASRRSAERLRKHGEVRFDYHGVSKELFDRDVPSPYAAGINVCWVGSHCLDRQFVAIAAEQFPSWRFHVIGADPGVERGNVVHHGELPFAQTVPFVKHADIGVAAYAHRPGVEALGDSSLKVLQFLHCGVPIVAPEFLSIEHSHVFYYRPGDAESIRATLERALAAGRDLSTDRRLASWEDLALTLARADSGSAAQNGSTTARADRPQPSITER